MSTLRDIPESEAIDLVRNKIMENGRVSRVPGLCFGVGPDDEWVTFSAAEQHIRRASSRMWSGEYLIVTTSGSPVPGVEQTVMYSYYVGLPDNPLDQYASVSGWRRAS